MSNQVEPLRHLTVFDPAAFGNKRVDVIGCGATGSMIVMQLAKLGVQNLHVHDFDVIEGHNIANQAFGICDIGQKKVDALARRVKDDTGLVVTTHDQAVTGRSLLGSVVFLLTDTMASRKEIWEGAIRYKPAIEQMFETRMGADEGRVYSVCPTNPAEVKLWEGTLCRDEEASESLCGARTTIGATAALVSAFATWAFLRWNNWQRLGGDQPEAENIFFARPPMTVIRHASLV